MHETCLIIIHDPGMRQGPESYRGLADECSTTGLTLLLSDQSMSIPVSLCRSHGTNVALLGVVICLSVLR